MLVSDLPQNVKFVSDSQDMQEIYAYLKIMLDLPEDSTTSDFSSFFYQLIPGRYTRIWGICGIVPYLTKQVWLVYGGES